jgi:hypothetical protein
MSTTLDPHENIEPLEKSKHQQLRLSKLQTFNFTKTISSVPISFSEMQPVSQFYPIILPADGNPTPMALLSIKEGTNRYVDEQGRWKVPYIPLCIRLYPFVLAKVENKEDQYALCLDRDAEHFAAGQGEPLFTADGEPNEFVQGVFNTLKLYQQELALTKAMFTALAEKELIADRKFDFQINGQQRSIDGFKGVNMEKLLTLDDKTIADFVKNGTMPMIYIHLQSLSKFAFLA